MPSEIDVEIERVVLPREINLPRSMYEGVGKLVAAAIVSNIIRQQRADGGAIKQNAPSTLQSKRDRGVRLRSLIDEGERLIRGRGQSFRLETSPNQVAVVPSSTARTGRPRSKPASAKQIARWVQEKGYVGWFGVGRQDRAAIKEWLKKEVREYLAKQTRKTRRQKL